jgi:hypothetical protein
MRLTFLRTWPIVGPVASGDSEAQRQEFERRVLALVRWKLDHLDEENPQGWEITDFIIIGRTYSAPEPDDDPKPWYGGPFPGWWQNGFTLGSSTSFHFDEELLEESLEYVRNRLAEVDDEEDDSAAS